jgi:hypothetical protein
MAKSAWRMLGVLGGVIALLSAAAPCPAKADDDVALAVIVGRNSKLTGISLSELRQAFRGEKPGAEGARLTALNHPPKTPDRVGFDQVVLGMDPEEAGRFWIARKVQGGPRPPRTIATLGTLRRVVEKLPGAIGYIRPAQLGRQVRAIRVDGKLPEDAGYPVHYHP